MSDEVRVIVAVAIIGAAAWYAYDRGAVDDWVDAGPSGDGDAYGDAGTVSAGDEQATYFDDAVDSMTSIFTNWPKGAEPYQDQITAAAINNGVPVEILAWLLWKESRYNPRIIDGSIRSKVGAMGIAQFMPKTAAQELGSVMAALNPAVAIPGAARYLAKLYRATGTWTEALAAYNWGIGNMQRKGIAAAPAETRDYFSVILAKAKFSEGMA